MSVLQLDIFGRSLYDLVIPEDHGELMAHLKRPPGNIFFSYNNHVQYGGYNANHGMPFDISTLVNVLIKY